MFDVKSKALRRVTDGAGDAMSPIFAPDGKSVFFASRHASIVWATSSRTQIRWEAGQVDVRRVRLDGEGEVEILAAARGWQEPLTVSPDGRTLILKESFPDTGTHLASLSLGDGRRVRLRVMPSGTSDVAVSPDGRWIAYASRESGREQLWLRELEEASTQWSYTPYLASHTGGTAPRWSRDGGELLYRDTRWLMAVPVSSGPPLVLGAPRVLFEGSSYEDDFDVSPDGRRFLMIRK
jgi:Tol biopolymer transport system component